VIYIAPKSQKIIRAHK